MDWRNDFDSEITRALQARQRGNEGQARVCARRAAGIVAREFLGRRGSRSRSRSAIDLLEQLRRQPGLPPLVLPLIDHLTQRVDQSFQLPAEVDLVAEVRLLGSSLLKD